MIVKESWVVDAVVKARKCTVREAKTEHAQDIAELDEWVSAKDLDDRSGSYIRALLIGRAEDLAGAKLAPVRAVHNGSARSAAFEACVQLIGHQDEEILRKVAEIIDGGGFSSDERKRLGHMLAGRYSAWKALADRRDVGGRQQSTGRLA